MARKTKGESVVRVSGRGPPEEWASTETHVMPILSPNSVKWHRSVSTKWAGNL